MHKTTFPVYLIITKYRDDTLDIGHMPLDQVPEDSILWKAMRDPEKLIDIERGMIRGIHFDQDLAEEHLKLEKAWRTHEKVILKIIKPDEINRE